MFYDMDKNSTLLCLLAKLYFRIESYDNFNYSVPPWSTSFMIFGIIWCFVTLPLALCKYLSYCEFAWLDGSSLKPFLGILFLVIATSSTVITIILEANGRKNYKRMELQAGREFLKQLEETRVKRPFALEVFVFACLFFVPIFINASCIVYLCI